MRDPFADYDAWLERPYQDQLAREAWIEENETAECATCGYEHGRYCELFTETVPDSQEQGAFCPSCNEVTLLKRLEPEEPEPFDYIPEEDEYWPEED